MLRVTCPVFFRWDTSKLLWFSSFPQDWMRALARWDKWSSWKALGEVRELLGSIFGVAFKAYACTLSNCQCALLPSS